MSFIDYSSRLLTFYFNNWAKYNNLAALLYDEYNYLSTYKYGKSYDLDHAYYTVCELFNLECKIEFVPVVC